MTSGGEIMEDINDTVVKNITREMRKHNTKQIELADAIGVTKQIMSKMLNGTRLITISELKKIASYFSVTTDALTHEDPTGTDVIRVFLGKVETEAAREALKTSDEIADLIIFYAEARANAAEMMTPWEM
jgi:transcriptional regulator with XRE-family HTH domain